MSLNTKPILAALESHAVALGRFERVNRHEPKNAPGRGLTAAIWVQRVNAIAAASGLAVTSALLTVNVRLYSNMLKEPQDEIDPEVIDAVDALMNAYSGDFALGGLIRNVDLLGMHSGGLSAEAGYLTQDKHVFRVVTITVPLVINDVWEQNA